MAVQTWVAAAKVGPMDKDEAHSFSNRAFLAIPVAVRLLTRGDNESAVTTPWISDVSGLLALFL